MRCAICSEPLTEATAFRRPAEVTECCPFCGKHRVPKQVILCEFHAAENLKFDEPDDDTETEPTEPEPSPLKV